MNQISSSAFQQAAAIIEFWRMAGVDYLVQEHPAGWLGAADAGDAAASAGQPPHTSSLLSQPPLRHQAPPHRTAPAHPPNTPGISPAEWPDSLDKLTEMIGNGAALPGNQFGGGSARPMGQIGARLMIISDLPDFDEITAGQLGHSAYGHLLANMVRAMGCHMADCYLTALATTRPAAGELPDGSPQTLVPFILHQMDIIRPKAVLVLGSAACNALFSAELMTARGNLHYFNHSGQKLAAVTTFHPRTLLVRPILKAQAWKDLQMLMSEEIL